jgi:hypothetical protein
MSQFVGRGDDAFAAGLLHQVGQLIFALGMPGPYGEVLARGRAGESLAVVGASCCGSGDYLRRSSTRSGSIASRRLRRRRCARSRRRSTSRRPARMV